jgi:glycosyltransferase involved in cell wall biosynthesis
MRSPLNILAGERKIEIHPDSSDIRRYRVAHIVSHPIQYYSPLYRYLSSQEDIDLTVYFQSDFSMKSYFDAGFGRKISWDTPLLEGFNSEFLPIVGSHRELSWLYPINTGIFRRLKHGKFDVLWVHGYSRWVNLYAILCARLLGIPTIIRDEVTYRSRPRSLSKTLFKRHVFFPLLEQLVDGFLCVGSKNRHFLTSNGIREDKLFFGPHCVDNSYFRALAEQASSNRDVLRTELEIPADSRIILFASKIVAQKRPTDLLNAYRLLASRYAGGSQPYLLFIGDGEARAELESQAAEFGGLVKFLGFKNQSELPAFFDLCDVFVMPAERENWGLIVSEVMNAGRPVVVSDDVGCSPDLVQSGVNGFVYRVGDVPSLAEAIYSTLSSTQSIAQMGMASRKIIDDWGFDRFAAEFRLALRQITGPRGR